MTKCAKCGKEANYTGGVSPVDEHGRTLDYVELCPECIQLWHKYYNSKGILKVNKDYEKNWAGRWKYFLSDRFTDTEKVKVEFS